MDRDVKISALLTIEGKCVEELGNFICQVHWCLMHVSKIVPLLTIEIALAVTNKL
jgi:hypothetical protein